MFGIYDRLPFSEVDSFEVGGTRFYVRRLNFKTVLDMPLILNFRHILSTIPPDAGHGDQTLRYDTVFYACGKGIAMCTPRCCGTIGNSKISYVRGSRITRKPVVYFCAYEEIRMMRQPHLHFIGRRTSYPIDIFMKMYDRRIRKGYKIYKDAVAGFIFPECGKYADMLSRADPSNGVFVDDFGVIWSPLLLPHGRYKYVRIIEGEKIADIIR